MPQTFNFTIRATDNVASFANRSFSITVNNSDFVRCCIARNDGIYKTRNFTSWTLDSTVTELGTKIVYFVEYVNDAWYAFTCQPSVGTGNIAKMWRSLDGVIWTEEWTGVTGYYYQLFYLNGQYRLVAIDMNGPGGVIRFASSASYPTSGTATDTGISSGVSSFSAHHSLTLTYNSVLNRYVMSVKTMNSSALGIYRHLYSDDGGATWTSSTPPVASSDRDTSHFYLINGVYFFCNSNGFYRSFDGITWTDLTANIVTAGFTPDGTQMTLGFGEGNLYLNATNNLTNRNYRSSDAGDTWVSLGSPVPGAPNYLTFEGTPNTFGLNKQIEYYNNRVVYIVQQNDNIAAKQRLLVDDFGFDRSGSIYDETITNKNMAYVGIRRM